MHMLENQTGQSAPQPPIPPVPASPGAATGGQVGPEGQPQAQNAAADAQQQAIQNAIQAAENAANAQQGEAGTTAPPPAVYQRDPDIPREVIPIIGIVFGSIVFMVIFGPIVRGIMKYVERRQDRQMVHGPSVANQLMQLQQSVDALAIEVERISESQRFTSKLMAERDKVSLPSGKGGA